jgi:hypothetical protein
MTSKVLSVRLVALIAVLFITSTLAFANPAIVPSQPLAVVHATAFSPGIIPPLPPTNPPRPTGNGNLTAMSPGIIPPLPPTNPPRPTGNGNLTKA